VAVHQHLERAGVPVGGTGGENVPASSASPGTDGARSGATVIADGVIATIAGIATQGVPGVYAVGGGVARAIGAIREAVSSTDRGQGVRVEVDGRQVAVDIALVAVYPTPLQQVADGVRAAVYTAIETIAGLEVVGVSVTVTQVHVPGDEDDEADAVAA